MLKIISITPKNENVSIRRDEAGDDKSSGGVVMVNQEPPQAGVVTAISDDVPEGIFRVGDRVLFDRLLVADEVETSDGMVLVTSYKNLKAIITIEEGDCG